MKRSFLEPSIEILRLDIQDQLLLDINDPLAGGSGNPGDYAGEEDEF